MRVSGIVPKRSGKRRLLHFFRLLPLVALCIPALGDIWYVDQGNTDGPWDGTSWGTAFVSIQDSIDAAYAAEGGEVWVAEGVYTGSGVRVVRMEAGVHLYGGFAGSETDRSQRDWVRYPSVIDGEEARRGLAGANDATLDRFVITQCTASDGAGMGNRDCSPTVTNCVFANNTADSLSGGGGGIGNENASSLVTNCVFVGNAATGLFAGGGAVANQDCSPTVTNCVFVGNTAQGGGAMACQRAAPTVTNCTFLLNHAGLVGGAMYNDDASPALANCILWENGPGQVYDAGSSASTITYSDVQAGATGTGNIDADPLFATGPSGTATALTYDFEAAASTITDAAASFAPNASVGKILLLGDPGDERAYFITNNDATSITVWADATDGGDVTAPVTYRVLDYHLTPGSPCIDAGRNTSAAEYGNVTDDLDGHPRPCDGDGLGAGGTGDGSDYDIGADEYAVFHNADTNEDLVISATEIGRVVGFYNAGGYCMNPDTVDGYAPGEGPRDGQPHHSDYAPQDWRISAVELGRLVTFYNAGGYHRDPATLDGFAPDLQRP